MVRVFHRKDLRLRLIIKRPVFSKGFFTHSEYLTEIIELSKDSCARGAWPDFEVIGAEFVFDKEEEDDPPQEKKTEE